MQELDTYHCIERYARSPRSATARLGFRALFKRAERKAAWAALTTFGSEHQENGIRLCIGNFKVDEQDADVSSVEKFAALTEDERQAVFKDALAKVGYKVDPEALMSKQQPKE